MAPRRWASTRRRTQRRPGSRARARVRVGKHAQRVDATRASEPAERLHEVRAQVAQARVRHQKVPWVCACLRAIATVPFFTVHLRACVRAYVRVFVRSCVRVFVRSFVRACVRSFVCSCVRSFVRSTCARCGACLHGVYRCSCVRHVIAGEYRDRSVTAEEAARKVRAFLLCRVRGAVYTGTMHAPARGVVGDACHALARKYDTYNMHMCNR